MIPMMIRYMHLVAFAGICMLVSLLAVPANASKLRDIRIGEYEGFTRIVFELDAPVASQTITPQNAGQLLVTFDGTRPALLRKIPVERSKHVRSIEFWERSNRFTIRFQLDYDHFRFEYFPLTNPPRLALDVYPLAAARPPPPNTIETRQDESQIREIRASSLAAKMKGGAGEAGLPGENANPTDTSSQPAGASSTEQPRRRVTSESLTPKSETKTVGSDIQPVRDATATDSPASDAAQPNGMHFYLVIGLVGITIIILVLLLVMLLTKRQWTDEQNEMTVNEFLKSQDKRIETLNKRIKEQFKRYEEA